MKRSFFRKKATKPLKRTRLAKKGKSPTALLKDEIQAWLRQLVILRDKKCILHGIRCNHEVGVNDEGVVWQAEHLIERSNSSTFADSRLVVLVCKNCHGWKHFKKSNHDQYDEWVKSKLSKERVALWDRVRGDRTPHKVDLKLELLALKQEYQRLTKV